MNSTHAVEVFKIDKIEKHPNADTLSILTVFDGYQSIVRTADFKKGDLAAFIPPDSIVPDTPDYAFLKGHLRVKACKLRGYLSQGLVVKAPPGSKEGDDVAAILGVTHYEPTIKLHGKGGGVYAGEVIEPPRFPGNVYDVDSWFRWSKKIPEDVQVEITEKIHGTNARFTYQDGKFYCGSRNFYRQESDNCLYWKTLRERPWLQRLLKRNEGVIVYGEIFGWVQDLHYGAEPGQTFFRVFDIALYNQFLPVWERYNMINKALRPTWWDKLLHYLNVRQLQFLSLEDVHVPIMGFFYAHADTISSYISGPSLVSGADNVREGIVIKPMTELWDQRLGRVILKAVSPEYLERAA